MAYVCDHCGEKMEWNMLKENRPFEGWLTVEYKEVIWRGYDFGFKILISKTYCPVCKKEQLNGGGS